MSKDRRKYRKMKNKKKIYLKIAYKTRFYVYAVTPNIFFFSLLTAVFGVDQFPSCSTNIGASIYTNARQDFPQMLPRRDLRDRIFLYTSAELTYVFAYYTSFMWPLRATFMPRRQYSRLDAARAVMSRWRNYVIGPRCALPILPVQQLLLLRLPGVMLSPRVSIWEHILPLSTIALQMREVWE